MIGRLSKAPALDEELLAIDGIKSHFSLRGGHWQVAHAQFNSLTACTYIWVALSGLSRLYKITELEGGRKIQQEKRVGKAERGSGCTYD